MNRINAVILDWAGTTVDFGSFAPTQIFVEAFRQAFAVEITLEEARVRWVSANGSILKRWGNCPPWTPAGRRSLAGDERCRYRRDLCCFYAAADCQSCRFFCADRRGCRHHCRAARRRHKNWLLFRLSASGDGKAGAGRRRAGLCARPLGGRRTISPSGDGQARGWRYRTSLSSASTR